MKRTLSVLGTAAAMALVVPATASALEGNEEQEAGCLAAGGTFEAVEPGGFEEDRCTVISTDTDMATLPGSHPRQAWTVEVATTTETTTVYQLKADGDLVFWSQIEEAAVVGPATVTSCTNHQGQAVSDFAYNPNCQPAA